MSLVKKCMAKIYIREHFIVNQPYLLAVSKVSFFIFFGQSLHWSSMCLKYRLSSLSTTSKSVI